MKNNHGYTVKGVKSFMGHEGQGYNCTLCKDGKKIASVIAQGDGGEPYFYFENKQVEEALYAFVKTLPKVKTEFPLGDGTKQKIEYSEDIGTFVASLVDDYDYAKRMKRLCKIQTVYRLDDTPEDSVMTLKHPYDAKVKAHLEKKYGKKLVEIVNETLLVEGDKEGK